MFMFVQMKVVSGNNFNIYVYKDHPPPHCHVRFSDNSEILVSLPLAEPLHGGTISKEIEESIFSNLNPLTEMWDKLNKPRKQKEKNKKRR